MNSWKILEVVIGITFVYLLLSLMASAALEWLGASLLHKGTGVMKAFFHRLIRVGWKKVGTSLVRSEKMQDVRIGRFRKLLRWMGRGLHASLRGLYWLFTQIGSILSGPFSLPPRHDVLEKALQQLLGPVICKEFYAHPLLRGFSEDHKKPSYITSKTFRLILLDLAMREYRRDAGPEADRAFVMQHLERMASASAQPDAAAKAGETLPADLVEPKEK